MFIDSSSKSQYGCDYMLVDPIFIIIIVIGSCFAGMISGLLGVGGGIILVPLFYTILDNVYGYSEHNIHIAVTTSLANIVITNSLATRTHLLKHNFNKNVFKNWFFFIICGAFLGGVMAQYLGALFLVLLFACFSFVLCLYMWFDNPFYLGQTLQRSWRYYGFAFFNGLISSLIGIGGGSFTVPYLTAYRVSMNVAVGTSSGISVIIALAALPANIIFSYGIQDLPPLSVGYLNGIFFISVMLFSPLFAYIFSRLTDRIEAKKLKKIFAIFLFFTSLKLFISSV